MLKNIWWKTTSLVKMKKNYWYFKFKKLQIKTDWIKKNKKIIVQTLFILHIIDLGANVYTLLFYIDIYKIVIICNPISS